MAASDENILSFKETMGTEDVCFHAISFNLLHLTFDLRFSLYEVFFLQR